MKKSYSITRFLAAVLLTLLVSSTANAQWRKTWDFTKGFSEETQANLNADTGTWAVNASTEGVATSWKNSKKGLSGNLMANGTEIEELKGIEFTTDGQSGGDFIIFADRKNFRLSRKGMKFKLPAITGGQTVTIMAKSANATATDRGFTGDANLEYIDGPEGGICLGPNAPGGSPDPYTLVWRVKDTVTDSIQVTFTLSPNGGLDILLIQIDNGDGPAIEEAKSVAYITNSAADGGFDDAKLALEGASDRIELTTIESTEAVTLDSLQTFQAVIVSPFVGKDDEIVSTLRSAIAYQPMLNLNSTLYEAWGLGEVVPVERTSVAVAEAYAESELFTDIDIEEGLNLLLEGNIQAIKPADYFAADRVIAYAGEDSITAIHQHNAGRNTYLNLPLNAESLVNPDVLNSLVVNAAVYVADTKTKVTAAGTPTINIDAQDMISYVTITGKGTIYYTIDGTEPTLESTIYTEPITFTDNATVKAFSTLDGYLPSKTVSTEVTVKSRLAAPEISIEKGETSSTVTMAAAEGADIYYAYHYEGKPLVKKDVAKYTAPITLSQEPTWIYAFATNDTDLDSPVDSAYVSIKSLNADNIRLDVVAHFNANQDNWINTDKHNNMTESVTGTGSASAYYYNTPDKKAWSYYTDEIDHVEYAQQQKKDEEGNPMIDDQGDPIMETVEVNVYKADPDALRTVTSATDTDWRIVSNGQVLISQNVAPVYAVGNGEAAYRAETAEDMIGTLPSKFDIQFGVKGDGDPYTGAVESTRAFQAPFDVVTHIGSGNDKSSSVMVLQLSTDGKTWETADTLKVSANQRYWKKTRVAVNKEGDYYVRVAHVGSTEKSMIFDIFILNNGELSKQYESVESGIDNVIATEATEIVATEIYNLNGIRLAAPAEGVNIVRTTYADGTVKIAKILK